MKFRLAAILLTLTAAGCGVTDESVVADEPAPEAAELAAPKSAEDPALAADVLAAIAQIPEEGGWPSVDEFQARHAEGIEPFRVMECERATYTGDEKVHETGPVMLLEANDRWAVVADADQSDDAWLFRDAWDTPHDLTSTAPAFRKNGTSLVCHRPRLDTVEPTPAAFGTYVYASVLTTPQEPTFVPPKISNIDNDLQRQLVELNGTEWSEANIQKLLELGPPASADEWGMALDWANAHERPDLAYEIHRRYRPVGYCSRDTRPQSNKQAYADVCRELSRPRCHLALSVELLGYRVSRRSDMWIDGKPVSYQSALDTLPEVVHRRLFMLGLLVDYPGAASNENAAISPRFFALATDGAEVAGELEATLKSWVQDPEVDPWNRHRFAVALFFLRTYGDDTKTPATHATELAALPGVPAVTAAQFANIEP